MGNSWFAEGSNGEEKVFYKDLGYKVVAIPTSRIQYLSHFKERSGDGKYKLVVVFPHNELGMVYENKNELMEDFKTIMKMMTNKDYD